MSEKSRNLTLVSAVGVALAGSLALADAQASDNPFGLTQLSGGYMQVAMNEGDADGGKAKEGSCGGDKVKAKAKEGNCGGDKAKAAKLKAKDGSCGEAKCGANK